MISVTTRVGVDIHGIDMLGAKTFAKIETDFAGTGNTYFLLRIRQAYVRFNWLKSELLVGQTWHPLFGNVQPDILSINTGAPFQPFNRSPQLRYNYKLNDIFSLTVAGIYQMQYSSPGPDGNSPKYIKEAVIPDAFLGIESKTRYWTTGAGFDTKTIKPSNTTITSFSATAYTQYINPKFQFKLKGIWGQNMSDYLLMNGYGVNKIEYKLNEENKPQVKELEYTNFNIFSTWFNVVYGSTWKVGMFAGFSQNLGTNKDLAATTDGSYIVYSRGYYSEQQLLANQVWRASAVVSYNLPKLRIGAEYNFTTVQYGTLKADGYTTNNSQVNNHRVIVSLIYSY